MFFKKFFVFFIFFCVPSISSANFLKEFTCFEDMKEYYPDLLTGDLTSEEQKRFFHCLRDALGLFIEKPIFSHDPNRSYFTKDEIIDMFSFYFEYDQKTSNELTNKLFFIKKALVGGSIDRLEDEKIVSLYNLIDDYQDIYFILHKYKVIPFFQKAFFQDSGLLTVEEKDEALKHLKKVFSRLNKAYSREHIVYPIDDLYRYSEYLNEAQFIGTSGSSIHKIFRFLHNLFEGLNSPQKAIQEKEWSTALQTLYKSVDLFLYYKTYFPANISFTDRIYRSIESMEIFVSLLETDKSMGYPLNNLDEMLSVLISFLDASSVIKEGWFANLNKDHVIPLFTRILHCFSLGSAEDRQCQTQWEGSASSQSVVVSFTDSVFKVFSNKIEREKELNQAVFMDSKQRAFLSDWLFEYKQSLLNVYYGKVEETAKQHLFDHWLNPFFGWDSSSSRIQFGASYTDNSQEKAVRLLNYQVFLPLFFESYLPDNFFSVEAEEPLSVPFKTWRDMMEHISPIFMILQGKVDSRSSLRSSLSDLFFLADSFLQSSNRDELLNAREFLDLTIHLLEAVKTDQLAYNKVSTVCGSDLPLACAVDSIFSDQEILAVYPRFEKYLFKTEIGKYKKRILSILEESRSNQKEQSFLALFLLIQVIELNYELIDRNDSFQLESDELLFFTRKFEDQFVIQVPYLSNSHQARAYLMYSFKTGDIPFLTDSQWTDLKFTHWYLNPKSRRPFHISPNEFHLLIFDFYRLYQKF